MIDQEYALSDLLILIDTNIDVNRNCVKQIIQVLDDIVNHEFNTKDYSDMQCVASSLVYKLIN
jgi:hypothetical protein